MGRDTALGKALREMWDYLFRKYPKYHPADEREMISAICLDYGRGGKSTIRVNVDRSK